MKKYIRLFLTAGAVAAVETGAKMAVVAKIEPTSEKLSALKASRKVAWAEMLKHEDAESDAAVAAQLAVWKIDQEIKAEKVNIINEENKAKLAEARNERVAFFNKFLVAYGDNLKIQAGKGTKEEKEVSQKCVDGPYEEIVNALLVKYPAAKTATAAETGTGTKGGTSAKIVELFLANRVNTPGITDADNKKAIEAAGYARGTTGSAILAWQKANGEKA